MEWFPRLFCLGSPSLLFGTDFLFSSPPLFPVITGLSAFSLSWRQMILLLLKKGYPKPCRLPALYYIFYVTLQTREWKAASLCSPTWNRRKKAPKEKKYQSYSLLFDHGNIHKVWTRLPQGQWSNGSRRRKPAEKQWTPAVISKQTLERDWCVQCYLWLRNKWHVKGTHFFFCGNINQVSRLTAALVHDTLESCRTRSSETTSPPCCHLHIRFINPNSILNITSWGCWTTCLRYQPLMYTKALKVMQNQTISPWTKLVVWNGVQSFCFGIRMAPAVIRDPCKKSFCS